MPCDDRRRFARSRRRFARPALAGRRPQSSVVIRRTGSTAAAVAGGGHLVGGLRPVVPRMARRYFVHRCNSPLARRRTHRSGSFRRFEQRRRAGAELLEQRRLVGLGGGEMPLLDVAEAADFFRDRGKADREVMVFRRQPAPAPRRASLRSRAISLRSVRRSSVRPNGSNGVPRRTLNFASSAERRQHPRAEAHLARQAGRLVAARQQRRRQMELEAQIRRRRTRSATCLRNAPSV